jgi:hypothetical protein
MAAVPLDPPRPDPVRSGNAAAYLGIESSRSGAGSQMLPTRQLSDHGRLMRRRLQLLALAAVGLMLGGCTKTAAGPHSADGDLKLICDFATRQVLKKGLNSESYVDFATQGKALELSSPVVAQAWAAFLSAPPQRRRPRAPQA